MDKAREEQLQKKIDSFCKEQQDWRKAIYFCFGLILIFCAYALIYLRA